MPTAECNSDPLNDGDGDVGSNAADNMIDGMSLEEAVRHWAVETNQDHISIELIMNIIRRKTGHSLPCSAKVLLRPAQDLNIVDEKCRQICTDNATIADIRYV